MKSAREVRELAVAKERSNYNRELFEESARNLSRALADLAAANAAIDARDREHAEEVEHLRAELAAAKDSRARAERRLAEFGQEEHDDLVGKLRAELAEAKQQHEWDNASVRGEDVVRWLRSRAEHWLRDANLCRDDNTRRHREWVASAVFAFAGQIENGSWLRDLATMDGRPAEDDVDRKFSVVEAEYRNEINQCDGCRRGLPVTNGIHREPSNAWGSMSCTADRYRTARPANEETDNG